MRRVLQGLQEIIWITGDYIDCKALPEIARDFILMLAIWIRAC
jgi:hypothetical protein